MTTSDSCDHCDHFLVVWLHTLGEHWPFQNRSGSLLLVCLDFSSYQVTVVSYYDETFNLLVSICPRSLSNCCLWNNVLRISLEIWGQWTSGHGPSASVQNLAVKCHVWAIGWRPCFAIMPNAFLQIPLKLRDITIMVAVPFKVFRGFRSKVINGPYVPFYDILQNGSSPTDFMVLSWGRVTLALWLWYLWNVQ